MHNTAYLNTWLRARNGLKTHWVLNLLISSILLSSIFFKYLQGSNVTGAIIIYSYIHGFIVAFFTHSLFAAKQVPMLPRRKSRSLFFSLMEWGLNLSTISAILGILHLFDPSLTQVSRTEIFQVFSSWGLGWIAFQVFSRMGTWVVFAMLALMYIQVDKQWLIWTVSLILSAAMMMGINFGKYFQDPDKTLQSSRFKSKRIRKPRVSYFNLIRIRSEFLQHPSGNGILRMLGLEFVITLLLFATGLLAHALLEFLNGEIAGEAYQAKQIGILCTLAFVRLVLKMMSSFSLENGLPILPAMSRKKWFERNQSYDRVDRAATLIMLIFVPAIINIIVNQIRGTSFLIAPEFRYYVMCILVSLPIILLVFATLSSTRNREVFSGSFVLSLSDRNRTNRKLPWKTMIIGYAVMIGLILTATITAATYRDVVNQLIHGQYVVIWVPPYLAIIACAYWLENLESSGISMR